MKRSAFSLIELIFVIIILGIISSVVIVKMGKMADKARFTKLKSFVGTLNRSVGPAIWFDSIRDNRNGSVAFANYQDSLGNYVDLIPNYTSGPFLVNCTSDGNGTFLSYSYEKNYEIHCTDGSSTTSPNFKLYNTNDSLYID